MANGNILGGLLSSNPGSFQSNPLLDIGLGILSASGPSPVPVGFGQILASGFQFANQRDQERLLNQSIRSRMSQEAAAAAQAQRQQAAQDRLVGILSSGEDVDQQQLLGLLADVAPSQVAQGLLGEMFPGGDRAAPSDIRTMQLLGIPTTPEGFAAFKQLEGQGGGGALDALKIQQGLLSTQIDALRVMQLERENKKEEADALRGEIEGKQSVTNTFSTLNELVSLNDRLEGTIAETGIGFSELRSAAAGPVSELVGMLGGDVTLARQLAADFKRFEQLTTDVALKSLFSGQVSAGTLTDAKLGTILTTKPGLDQPPDTNRKIFADMLRSNLDSAEKLGVDVPNRAQIDEQIKTLRQPSAKPTARTEAVRETTAAVGEAVTSAVKSVADIGKLTLEELTALDLTTLTTDALEAARKRFDELTAGSQ